MKKVFLLPEVSPKEQTPIVQALLALTEELIQRVNQQDEEILLLKDEINVLKGEKKRPVFKPSKLDKDTDKDKDSNNNHHKKKKKGSRKRKKNINLTIHEETIIHPMVDIPDGSIFKGYKNFVVQNLNISCHNIRYRLAHWITPDKKSIVGKLPSSLKNQHFGAELIRYVIYQYHHCQTTQPLILEQLREWGIDISSGQINRILSEKIETFHQEKNALLHCALASSSYVSVDDSGARHKGKNGFVTQIGNDWFAWFQSTASKSRINFLELLCAGTINYCLTDAALDYMKARKLPEEPFLQMSQLKGEVITNEKGWLKLLESLSVNNKRHIRIMTEGALFGCLLKRGLLDDLVILSDDAGQFNLILLYHALCWVHTERLIHKMLPLNERHKQEISELRSQVWAYYARLKKYKNNPNSQDKTLLNNQFDQIFTQKTSYVTLNILLHRIYKNKAELLMVLERPEIPLHTNVSETDIREYVKRRKISGGTRSDEGRRCRDTFASLKKTCRKLGISFWDYLADRLGIEELDILPLGEIVSERARLATGY